MNTSNDIKYTLRKINNIYVIASNQDIIVGALYITEIGQIATCIEVSNKHIRGRISLFETCRTPIKECYKVEASDNIPDTIRIDFNGYQKTLGYIDVDMIAYADGIPSNKVDIYKQGFYKKQELNIEYKYTLNDVKNALEAGLGINYDHSFGDETSKYINALELSKLLKWNIELNPVIMDGKIRLWCKITDV